MTDVHTKLSTAVLCGDVNCKPLFTCQKALPLCCMWHTVARTDTNFLLKATGKQYYVLILLSPTCPAVSYTCQTPLQMFAAKPQASISAVSLLQNGMGLLMCWSAVCGVSGNSELLGRRGLCSLHPRQLPYLLAKAHGFPDTGPKASHVPRPPLLCCQISFVPQQNKQLV